MKRIFLLITVLGAALVAGCGTDNEPEVITYSINDVTMSNDETETTVASSDQATPDDTENPDDTNDTDVPEDTDDTDSSTDKSDNKTVESVSDDKFAYTVHDRYMDLDSDKGPYYIIDLDSMSVVDCTSAGARVVDYKLDGDILTITLYSNEYPVNSTYVVDLSTSTDDTITSQTIENNVLKFSSEKGPDYEIDLDTMKLISCSDKTGRIVKSSLDGDQLTLVLYSKTLPVDMTYVITIE